MILTVRQGVPENGYNENKNKIYVQMCIIMKSLHPEKKCVMTIAVQKLSMFVCVCVKIQYNF